MHIRMLEFSHKTPKDQEETIQK